MPSVTETGQPARVYRIYMVEDDATAVRYLQHALADCPDLKLVGLSPTLAHARAHAAASRADLYLLDLGLPDGSGETLIEEIAEAVPDSVRLVLSLFEDESHVLRAIEAGANGYLLKGGTAAQLQQAMREALQGQAPISPAIARHLLKRLQSKADTPPNPPAETAHELQESDGTPAYRLQTLSSREHEVLMLIAAGHRNAAIAERLHLSAHTVHSHVRTIYRKLYVRNRAQAARVVFGSGQG